MRAARYAVVDRRGTFENWRAPWRVDWSEGDDDGSVYFKTREQAREWVKRETKNAQSMGSSR
jgi:hypothetical protein